MEACYLPSLGGGEDSQDTNSLPKRIISVMSSPPLPTKQQAMKVCVLPYAVVHFDRAQLETGV